MKSMVNGRWLYGGYIEIFDLNQGSDSITAKGSLFI